MRQYQKIIRQAVIDEKFLIAFEESARHTIGQCKDVLQLADRVILHYKIAEPVVSAHRYIDFAMVYAADSTVPGIQYGLKNPACQDPV